MTPIRTLAALVAEVQTLIDTRDPLWPGRAPCVYVEDLQAVLDRVRLAPTGSDPPPPRAPRAP